MDYGYPNFGNYGVLRQPPISLVRVNGVEGAKAYQMPANSTAALFDGSNDLFYLKVTDGAGFPTIRTFRFEEVLPVAGQAAEWATKDDVQALHREVESLREAINGKLAVPATE